MACFDMEGNLPTGDSDTGVRAPSEEALAAAAHPEGGSSGAAGGGEVGIEHVPAADTNDPPAVQAVPSAAHTEGGLSSATGGATSDEDGPKVSQVGSLGISHISTFLSTESSLEVHVTFMKQIMPKIIRQIPLCLLMSLPTFALDAIIAYVFKPQQPLEYESDWHREHGNATFNVHFQWMPGGEDRPGSLAEYSSVVWTHSYGFAILQFMNLIMLPYWCLDRESFSRVTRRWYYAIVAVLMALDFVFTFLAGANASKMEGAHDFVVAGRLSSAIPMVLIIIASFWHRGRQIKRSLGNPRFLMVLLLISMQSVVAILEVVYLIGGLKGMDSEAKERIIFIYRLMLWPFIWVFIFVPLQRFTLAYWPGKPEKTLPFLAWYLAIAALSARILMFRLSSPMFFLILNVCDTLLQCAFNWYDSGAVAIVDRCLFRCCWGRCFKALDNIDMKHVRMVRMFWCQAQTMVDLTALFCLAFREIMFWDNRYMFVALYKPTCNSTFDFESLFVKVFIGMVCAISSDLVSCLVAHRQQVPVGSAYHILATNLPFLTSLSVVNFLMFSLGVSTLAINAGRNGDCEDFDNGCTCSAVQMFREICGCCTSDSAQLAASPYLLCKAQ